MNPYKNNEYLKLKGFLHFIYDDGCFTITCKNKANHIHHLNKVNTDNSPGNLIPTCPQCHKLYDKVAIIDKTVINVHIAKAKAKINEMSSNHKPDSIREIAKTG